MRYNFHQIGSNDFRLIVKVKERSITLDFNDNIFLNQQGWTLLNHEINSFIMKPMTEQNIEMWRHQLQHFLLSLQYSNYLVIL